MENAKMQESNNNNKAQMIYCSIFHNFFFLRFLCRWSFKLFNWYVITWPYYFHFHWDGIHLISKTYIIQEERIANDFIISTVSHLFSFFSFFVQILNVFNIEIHLNREIYCSIVSISMDFNGNLLLCHQLAKETKDVGNVVSEIINWL